MKKHLTYGFALALLFVPTLFAQMSGDKKAAMPDCKAMTEQHAAMEQHMAEMDGKMGTMVAEMNKATGAAKVDKTAAALTELVAQRSMMQKQMMEMHPKMMEHMMQHMKGGMMTGMSDSMSGCPMMKDGEKGGKPAAEHKR